MPTRFLLIGNQSDAAWVATLEEAIRSLGQLYLISETEAVGRVQQEAFDLVIVDAGTTNHIADFVSRLRMARPAMPIVVVTASPTWQRARKVLLAGANDYIRKSLDTQTLLVTFKDILSSSTAI
jgi:DNA-binding response OmpR family regulator